MHLIYFSIDKLLNGGLMTEKVYELCGPPSSGKTQFCLTLCKNISSNLQQTVLYLDTKKDFSAKRLKKMLSGRDEVPKLKLRFCPYLLIIFFYFIFFF